MPKLSLIEGKNFSDFSPGTTYRARIENMLKRTYESFEEIKQQASDYHLTTDDFSILDRMQMEVPKEAIFGVTPKPSYWPVFCFWGISRIRREVVRIKVVPD